MGRPENKFQQQKKVVDLLVDANNFWDRLKDDIESARDRVYIQTLSFEGDRVGKKLSDQILKSPAPDKKIIIDNYTRFVLSDKFIHSPRNWFDSGLRQEARDTARMIEDLNSNGTKVRFVNPVGFLFARLPARNHKKIIVIDDRISYIGGINFSEHNFEWHDLMLRIEDGKIASFLGNDFLTSWDGKHFGGRIKSGMLELHAYDGAGNETAFEPLMKLIDEAQSSIYVQSPYLCQPFTGRLACAADRDVNVTVVSPEQNNKKAMGSYIRWEAARSGFDIGLYQKGMTHLKAMLIDQKYLIIGSTNFDYFSYRFHQETMAIITDKRIISEFIEQVIDEDDRHCRRVTNPKKSLNGYLRNLQINIVCRLADLLLKR